MVSSSVLEQRPSHEGAAAVQQRAGDVAAKPLDRSAEADATRRRKSALPSYARPTRASQCRARNSVGSFMPPQLKQPTSSPYPMRKSTARVSQVGVKPKLARKSVLTGSSSQRQQQHSTTSPTAISSRAPSAALKADGAAAHDQQPHSSRAGIARPPSASSSVRSSLTAVSKHSHSSPSSRATTPHPASAAAEAQRPSTAAVSTASRAAVALPSTSSKVVYSSSGKQQHLTPAAARAPSHTARSRDTAGSAAATATGRSVTQHAKGTGRAAADAGSRAGASASWMPFPAPHASHDRTAPAAGVVAAAAPAGPRGSTAHLRGSIFKVKFRQTQRTADNYWMLDTQSAAHIDG